MLASGQPPGQMGERQELLCGNQHGPKTMLPRDGDISRGENRLREGKVLRVQAPMCDQASLAPIALVSHPSKVASG